jgi:cyclic pyranopterin phosphate synthase
VQLKKAVFLNPLDLRKCGVLSGNPPLCIIKNHGKFYNMLKLSHISAKGYARMVDVSQKEPTHREALATARVVMKPETVVLIVGGRVPKGDVFGVARIAGIMAAKRTSELIPMCHPLELTAINIDFHSDVDTGEVTIDASVKTIARTGVEMEAMTAASVAALTIYDMCKSADKEITLTDIKLVKKQGGKSGLFIRKNDEKRG